MGMTAVGRALVAGTARGRFLRLAQPVSLWGGVDPVEGRIADPRHPDYGTSIVGTVLAIPQTVGSSSSSAIMLELLRHRTAPAAVLLGNVDAILTLGVVVGGELGHPTIPVLAFEPDALPDGPAGSPVVVTAEGEVRWER